MRRALVVTIVVAAHAFVRTASAAPCDTKVKDLEQQLAKMTKDVAAANSELAANRAQRVERDKRTAAIKEVQRLFEPMVTAGDLELISRRGAITIELPAEGLFDPGKAALSRKGETDVVKVAAILEQFPDRRYLVVGHTDNTIPKGTEYKDNWELSAARALAVSRAMVQAGVGAVNVVAAGSGESDPVEDNSTAAGRQHNRRIEIVFLPVETELPAVPVPAGN